MVISIIGSFRKHFADIQNVISLFERQGHTVLSPKCSHIVGEDDGFVILSTDNPRYSPIDIQTMVFHRAFRSDFVYVWNPEGYIGKTTCYEIGRLTERRIPLFYKEYPLDVPIYIPKGSVISPGGLIDYIDMYNRLPILEHSGTLLTEELITALDNNIFYD